VPGYLEEGWSEKRRRTVVRFRLGNKMKAG